MGNKKGQKRGQYEKDYLLEIKEKKALKEKVLTDNGNITAYYVAIRTREQLATLGMTADTLSKKSGLSAGTINKVIHGELSNPNADTLLRLSKALETSPNYLLGITHVVNVNPDIEIVSKTTGLTENAIKTLLADKNSKEEKRNINFSQFISAFIENGDLILDYINEIYVSKEDDFSWRKYEEYSIVKKTYEKTTKNIGIYKLLVDDELKDKFYEELSYVLVDFYTNNECKMKDEIIDFLTKNPYPTSAEQGEDFLEDVIGECCYLWESEDIYNTLTMEQVTKYIGSSISKEFLSLIEDFTEKQLSLNNSFMKGEQNNG